MDNRWIFFQLPNKRVITKEESNYWVDNLRKILKIGLEFEFNLPNAKGFCKGVCKSCPCVHLKEENDCWKKCLNEENCKQMLGNNFEAQCVKQHCTSFKAACYDCGNFSVDCLNCIHRFDPNSDPDGIREHLRDVFSPTKSYGNINASGVHSVVCDGSLLGTGKEGKGAEIITVGRRVDYWEFFNMISKIIKESKDKGAYVNDRCSTHAHLLASYYDLKDSMRGGPQMSELERPLPQIVLANLHQLCRKYQNAITWMSMALDTPEHLTRWEKYRVSILDVSPATATMKSVIETVSHMAGKNGKYAWINYNFLRFNHDNDLSRFHIEMRVLDGMMSESAITALSCLFFALVIKAVEISKYGLLEVGSKQWFEKTARIKSRLMNNNSDWDAAHRSSNTHELSENDMDVLREESFDLLNHLKHILFRLGPAYDVLEKLASTPIALRRVAGESWDTIEENLAVYRPTETILEQKIFEIIDLRTVTKLESEEAWVAKVWEILSVELKLDNMDILVQIIRALKNEGLCIWSTQLGTLLKV
ncbi:hypothetical protein JZU46_01000 [bacterium]|nr:hypothetical protein [bacterium]